MPDARATYEVLEGRTTKQAQARIVQLLRDSGDLVGEPRPITHPVKFYERGEHPLEIVSSQQWYVPTMAMRERLVALGRRLEWHPEFMRARYEAWVEGLTGDWNISRQRFFGVPFPLWYRLDADGEMIESDFLLPRFDQLPVDPSTDVPEGFGKSQRNKPNGFTGDPDVMDTWATSSLTPEIAGHWIDDEDLFSRVFPMDLRPQAHEIIRTWLFSTVVRSELEFGCLPGSTRPSRDGSSTRTARRWRSRRATSSCRPSRSNATAPMPFATGRSRPGSGSTRPTTTSR